jgi:cytoskeletal protein CcmA (bactofilin family)
MWKRENEPNPPAPAPAIPTSTASTAPPAAPRREPEPASAPAARAVEPPAPVAVGRASIGAGTVVRGEISGEEDLLVEGRVEGKIDLKGNSVTVGAKGRLSAEVHARAILIDGEVDGDLTAEEQIVVRKGGRVKGDLTAPRVTIEDGARFKGSIDMEPKRASSPAPASMPARTGGGKGDPIASLAAAAGSSS